jgi:hypothetical protein
MTSLPSEQRIRAELYRLAKEASRNAGNVSESDRLNRLRQRTANLLFGDRIVALPRDFLESPLNLYSGSPLKAILEAWNPEAFLCFRKEASRDMDAREWRTVLKITKDVVGVPAECERSYNASDELLVKNGWRNSNSLVLTHCRTKKDSLIVALRAIEAIHQERPFTITCVQAFRIEKKSLDWQLTGNEAIPAIRIRSDSRMIWRFAKKQTRRRLWDLLKTL